MQSLYEDKHNIKTVGLLLKNVYSVRLTEQFDKKNGTKIVTRRSVFP